MDMAKTKVVFVKDASPHGRPGDIKDVAGGFFRNALMPRGVAVFATPDRIKQAEAMRRRREEGERLHHEQMEAYATKMDGIVLEFVKKANEKGGLFDALDTREIIQELHQKGFTAIEEKHIDLERPFDNIGEYTVTLRLGENLPTPALKVVIKEEE